MRFISGEISVSGHDLHRTDYERRTFTGRTAEYNLHPTMLGMVDSHLSLRLTEQEQRILSVISEINVKLFCLLHLFKFIVILLHTDRSVFLFIWIQENI